MAHRPVFTLEEAAAHFHMEVGPLLDWLEHRLISPSFVADDQQPLFDDNDLAHLEGLVELYRIGYATADIRKITRKVGLPKVSRRGKGKVLRRYLTVGELASRCGLNPRTIKYWEERGIIAPTTRSSGGFRLYDEEYVTFCRLIQDLQLFGYTLEEIKGVAGRFKVYSELRMDRFSGNESEAQAQLDDMLQALDSLSVRMDELTKGVQRWRKLIKDKRSEVLGFRRRYGKSAEKPAEAIPEGGENPSSS